MIKGVDVQYVPRWKGKDRKEEMSQSARYQTRQVQFALRRKKRRSHFKEVKFLHGYIICPADPHMIGSS